MPTAVLQTSPGVGGEGTAPGRALRACGRALACAVLGVVLLGLAVPAAPAAHRFAGVAHASPAGQESAEYYEALWQAALAELNAAATCDEAVAALTKLTGVERARQQAGYYTDDSPDPLQYAPKVHGICYEEFFAKCRERQDPAYGVAMRQVLRATALIGNDALDASKVERCLTFELRFDGRFTLNHMGFDTAVTYRASVPVESSGDGLGTWNGQAPLDNVELSVRVPAPASVRDARGDSGELKVPLLISDFPYEPGSLERGQALDLQILLQTLIPTLEHWTVEFPPMLGTSIPPIPTVAPLWMGSFQGLHADEQLGDAGWLIKDFQHVGGSVYARRGYNRTGTSEGVPVQEQTTVELWHTPKP